MDSSSRRVAVWTSSLFALTIATACGSAPATVDPAILEQEAFRLLAPYRQAQTLIANEVEIRMTSNFYSEITMGVSDTMHETSIEQRDGHTIYEYRPKASFASGSPMRFQLEQTRFLVTSMMRIVVLGGKQDWTLRTRAADVALVRGDTEQRMMGVEIHNGAFSRK